MNELSTIIAELRRCGEALISLSEKLDVNISGQEQPAEPAPVPETESVTLETVRAVLAEKSLQGKRAEVQELIRKHGADKLSKIDPARYTGLLAEAEAL